MNLATRNVHRTRQFTESPPRKEAKMRKYMRTLFIVAVGLAGCYGDGTTPVTLTDGGNVVITPPPCVTNTQNCDGDPATGQYGCEVITSTDVKNCGKCYNACRQVPNSAPVCDAGSCKLSCNVGWADCNGLYDDGCETNLANPGSCGGCNKSCSDTIAHATSTCSSGSCQFAVCDQGWSDCNTTTADGCETATSSDPNNCGGCNRTCSGQNIASVSCTNSRCDGVCKPGYDDCNNDKLTDGCETDKLNDPSNCGGCDVVCPAFNGTPSCQNGTCAITCNAGFSTCGHPENGCNINLNGDGQNCGACGNVCDANEKCSGGKCVVNCSMNEIVCQQKSCINPQTDSGNCGGCNAACSSQNIASPTCSGGACNGTCNAGYADCFNGKRADGCETNIKSDVSNCGGCNVTCSSSNVTPSCSNGRCDGSCTSDFADCNSNKQTDGCEKNIKSDASNCGVCGFSCSSNGGTPFCQAGACGIVCSSGHGDCNINAIDGCEVTFSSDPANCGACAAGCSTNHLTPSCSSGNCNGSCAVGYADCDGNKRSNGCEVNTLTDWSNCGTCGHTCYTINGSSFCDSGACLFTGCNPGFKDCNSNIALDGCEQEVFNDPSNCGACGHTCSIANGLASCWLGQCGVGTCDLGYVDCNQNSQDGCECNVGGGQVCDSINKTCTNPNGTPIDAGTDAKKTDAGTKSDGGQLDGGINDASHEDASGTPDAGTNDASGAQDAATSTDSSTTTDAASSTDAALPPVDGSKPFDGTVPVDSSLPVDGSKPVDLGHPADLVSTTDLAKIPNHHDEDGDCYCVDAPCIPGEHTWCPSPLPGDCDDDPRDHRADNPNTLCSDPSAPAGQHVFVYYKKTSCPMGTTLLMDSDGSDLNNPSMFDGKDEYDNNCNGVKDEACGGDAGACGSTCAWSFDGIAYRVVCDWMNKQ